MAASPEAAIRLELTLAFTGVMAVVPAATGLFLHLRLAAQLDQSLAQGRPQRARPAG